MVDYHYSNIYKDRIVLVTGHTGFKGSWLCAWLHKLGAVVIGYSLQADTPSHFELLELNITSIIGDILDKKKLDSVFNTYKPEIVFHLAAQSLVRYSYTYPRETFETNIMGTINVFEACRSCESVKAIINITSDKAYENTKQTKAYVESDAMGGYDPYSASKGCSELVTSSYRNAFLTKEAILLASCRAGNVIGGGDWAKDRLIPDIMKAIDLDKIVEIRSPNAIRPWQHVLEPLSAYLLIGQKLLEGKEKFAQAWNFGPNNEDISVKDILNEIKQEWNKLNYEINEDDSLHEADVLKLDCSKAHKELHWKPKYNTKQSIQETVIWYKEFYENKKVITFKQIEKYMES